MMRKVVDVYKRQDVCLTKTLLIHRNLMFHILGPQYFRPVTAIRIYRTAVIKYNRCV